MAQYRRKRPPRRSRTMAAILAVVNMVLLAGLLLGQRGWLRLRNTEVELERLAAANRALRQSNEAARARLERRRHSLLYVEKVAREELNMAREGEVVYRVVPEPAESRRATEGNGKRGIDWREGQGAAGVSRSPH